MGATNFSNIAFGKFKNVHAAYNKLVQDALYSDGYDPYNGTISTTNGCRDVTRYAPRYGTKMFQVWEDGMLEKYPEARSDAFAVEIKGKVFNEIKLSHGAKGKKGFKAYYFFGWAKI